jgi:hypothetical protein
MVVSRQEENMRLLPPDRLQCAVWALALSGLAACSSEDASRAPRVPERLGLVANWLAGGLSYVDVNSLRAGASTRDEIVTADLTLTECTPGPFDVVLSPDQQTALVSCSTGWLGSSALGLLVNDTLPSVGGQLLLLDVQSGRVRARLDGGYSPTSAAFTPDGGRAVVVNFGELAKGDSELIVIDIPRAEIIDRVPSGRLSEELAFDDTGTVAIYGFGDSGSLRTFAVDDPRSTLSPEISLVGGSAGLAFFPGTKIAFAVQIANPLGALTGGSTRGGYTLVDVSDPRAPVVLADERDDDGAIAYPVVPAPGRGTVLVPVTVDGQLILREYALEGEAAKLVESIEIGDANLLSAIGLAFDGEATALIAWPARRALVRVDLDARTTTVIPWQDRAGPTEIALR